MYKFLIRSISIVCVKAYTNFIKKYCKVVLLVHVNSSMTRNFIQVVCFSLEINSQAYYDHLCMMQFTN